MRPTVTAVASPSVTRIPTSEPAGYAKRRLALPVVLSAMFMAMFDYFVVNVAASSLQHDLHAGDAALELIVGGYGFAYASGLITGGRLGDLYGYRRLFILGMGAFAVASLLCGLAPNAGLLVAFRILQGATAALMVPQMLALINTMFPPHERVRAMAGFGATIGVGAVAGQVLGGVLIDANVFGWGWRAIFFINVPIGLVAVLLAARWLPGHQGDHRPRLDPLGALGFSATLALILVPVTLGRSAGWPVWTWLSMIAALPVLALTVLHENRLEQRGGQPVVDLALVRQRHFAAGMVIGGGYLAFFAGYMLTLTLLLQDGLGLSALAAGLTFAPLGVCFAISSFQARRIAARIGNRVITLGATISLIGTALTILVLSFDGLHSWWLIPGMAIVGVGNGMAIPTVVTAVLSSGIPAKQAGMAAGAMVTAQQFGNAIGATVLGTVFFSVLGATVHPADFAAAMRMAAFVGFGILILVFAATLLLPNPRPRS